MRWLGAFGLFCVIGVAQAAPDKAGLSTRFRVNGVDIVAPIPNGYCLPTGRHADVAQLLAAGDTRNVTHLTLLACVDGRISEGDDYILIKTPLEALTANVTRDQLLEAVGSEFEKPDFLAAISDSKISGEVAASLSKILGSNVNLASSVRPLGKDESCAYIGGTVEVAGPVEPYKVSFAGCITAVGDRVVTIYRYGADNSASGIAALVLKSKAYAEMLVPTAL